MSPPQTDPRIPIAAKDQAALAKYIGHCESLGRYQAKDVLVVRGYGGDLQLWVNPSYSNYRTAWVSAFGTVPTGYDVDHVYSKDRGTRYGYGYVRLALVDGSINKGSGTVEKLMGQVHQENVKAGYAMQPPEIRYADDVQERKLRHVSFKPSQGYAERQKPGQAILGGSRLVGVTKPLPPLAQPVPLTQPRNEVAVKPLVPQRKLRVTSVTIQPAGTGVRVFTGPKSYEWSGAVVGWVMSGLVTAVNSKRMEEALDKILPRVEPHIPKGGGVLLATMYEHPDNADQYNFSTDMFMYAYVLGYGATAQEAYQHYLKESSRPGYATLSPAAQKNWSKVEHHVWVSADEASAR
ncbi:hypothetical protein [Corallococcus carmarthensis]|uniref:Uncharacterized protein n=1 Tax=Corallococcus carmarthensis TaxID=2316728 RepID=A0A3A8KH01_9BACT|nr:hypothetical protein [Corallococcus carmarthensis]RKH03481.1 hypothetical protein D7X32_13855 [Corallococcus carmarthensis]